MSKRILLGTVISALIVTMVSLGTQISSAQTSTATPTATGDDSGTLSIQVTGTVLTITPVSQNGGQSVYLVTLADGTQVLDNPGTHGASNFVVGHDVTVIAA